MLKIPFMFVTYQRLNEQLQAPLYRSFPPPLLPNTWRRLRVCPTITDQAMPFVLLQLHPQPLLRITTKTGIWWKSSEMFSITIKLPICLYNKYSQVSFTETLLFWSLPHQLEMTTQFLMLIALFQHSSSEEGWYQGSVSVIHLQIWGIYPNGSKIHQLM